MAKVSAGIFFLKILKMNLFWEDISKKAPKQKSYFRWKKDRKFTNIKKWWNAYKNLVLFDR